ncbi:oxidative stress-induced growth inhibitor 2 [Denticeps clupeoides]|uniref:Oxidative stress induced growth inhibitor family member 2 n=1 Tax=Denticeps clupeoides TaxID=299321 RepID=A0AAY4AT76_9TELE|nr:oxidative stress-induced growth inhibitor 2-like [Denticeps clupeoides]
MPLVEESSLRDGPPTVPVVIIGNGPSGICLSYILSGYTPYLDPTATHPNAVLYSKLQENKHAPITEQDLEHLSEGLEGRSPNPVGVLFDTLLHPNADLGFELPPLLQWKLEAHRHIPHLVLGKATPGGAWHGMEGSMLTISLGIWMELPGVNYRDLTPGKLRGVASDRASPEQISSYYRNYVKIMGLQKNFVDNTYVTSIQKRHRNCNGSETDGGMENGSSNNGTTNRVENGSCNGEGKTGGVGDEGVDGEGLHSISQGLWEVRGYQHVQDRHVPFCLFAENIVLATGASDSPARLGVEGEELPFVFHSVRDLGLALSRHGNLGPASDPVLVVGAGLSAADAVLCACNKGVSVLHAFRKRVDDPGLIFKQLPKTLYPEYHQVYHMMCTHAYLAPSSNSSSATNSSSGGNMPTATTASPPGYISFPEHCIISFQPDMRCILQGPGGTLRVFKISMALVLIGSHPNLFFLKEQGRYLTLDPSRPVSCRHNPLDIHPYSYECCAEPGFFAMGPLVGDNFVRFLKGGALGIASCLLKRWQEKQKTRGKLIAPGGGKRGSGSDREGLLRGGRGRIVLKK